MKYAEGGYVGPPQQMTWDNRRLVCDSDGDYWLRCARCNTWWTTESEFDPEAEHDCNDGGRLSLESIEKAWGPLKDLTPYSPSFLYTYAYVVTECQVCGLEMNWYRGRSKYGHPVSITLPAEQPWKLHLLASSAELKIPSEPICQNCTE